MSQQGTPAAQKANGALSCTERAGKEGTDPLRAPSAALCPALQPQRRKETEPQEPGEATKVPEGPQHRSHGARLTERVCLARRREGALRTSPGGSGARRALTAQRGGRVEAVRAVNVVAHLQLQPGVRPQQLLDLLLLERGLLQDQHGVRLLPRRPDHLQQRSRERGGTRRRDPAAPDGPAPGSRRDGAPPGTWPCTKAAFSRAESRSSRRSRTEPNGNGAAGPGAASASSRRRFGAGPSAMAARGQRGDGARTAPPRGRRAPLLQRPAAPASRSGDPQPRAPQRPP